MSTYGAPPAYGQPYDLRPQGPLGTPRSTGVGMLLFVATFGLYGFYWFFVTSQEMKQHSGEGLGSALAVVVYLLAGVASPFVTSHEVGQLYARQGQPQPVSAATGLWVVPGFLLLLLPIVWFVKTNGALNAYWRALGATG